jgi:flagellar hook-length control protein FliK
MSENIQLAAVMIPTQPAPAQTLRPQSQNPYQTSSSTENQTCNAESTDSSGSRELPVRDKSKNAFNRLLNEKLENRHSSTTESSESNPQSRPIPAQMNLETPLTFAELLTSVNAQMAGGTSEITPDLQRPQTDESGIQSSAAGSLPAEGLIAAAQIPAAATETVTIQNRPVQTQQTAFADVLKGRTVAADSDGNVPAQTASADTSPQQSQPQTGRTPASTIAQQQQTAQTAMPDDKPAADTRPQDKSSADKQPNGNLPILPQKAVENTADTPAAQRSPVMAAQPRPAVSDSTQTEPAAEVDADQKSSHLPDTLPQDTEQPPAVKFETDMAVSEVSVTAAQHKVSVLNVAEKAPASAVETLPADKVRAADAVTASRPIEQIAQKLAAEPAVRADQQIRLTLTPAELGTVRITFKEQEGEVIGLMEVQKPQTRKELEESLPQLMTAMQTQGVQVRRIEVVQWNVPQQGTRDSLSEDFNPSAEREFFQQRTGTPQEGSSNNRQFASSSGFSSQTAGAASLDAPDSQQWFSDKSLNLYI